jgi:hypothetical protein
VSVSREARVRFEWAAVLGLVAIFVVLGVLPACRRINTDFPNYYLAATLLRKGFALDRAYDWLWFQRQKDHAGIDWGVVGYVPLSPYSALIMVPLSRLAPLVAKQTWVLLDVGLLGATTYVLWALTRMPVRRILILIFLTLVPLQTNVEFGQQYVLLLFLLAAAALLYARDHDFGAGSVLAFAAALKIFPVGFGLLFLLKRRWRAAAGLSITGIVLLLLAFPLFGAETMRVYLFDVLPRSLAGETNDPYYAGFNTPTVLLRRLFVGEPDLNPHPLVHALGAYVVLQPIVAALTLIPALWLITPAGSRRDRETLEWGAFVALLLVGSTESSTYHFCPLILTTVVTVDFLWKAGRRELAGIIAGLHTFVSLPLNRFAPASPEGLSVFLAVPRMYGLLAYWGVLLWVLAYVGSPEPRPRGYARLFALAFALMVASGIRSNARHFDGLGAAGQERLPGLGSEGLSVVPAARGAEVYYSRMTDEGYGLARAEGGLVIDPPRGTDLLHPTVSEGATEGWVEVASRASRIARFPLDARAELATFPTEIEDGEQPVISSDAKWLAFLREGERGAGRLWVAARKTGDAHAADKEAPRTDDGYDVLDFAFLADDRIVMAARRGNVPGLFVLDPTTWAVTPLGVSDARVRYPSASPDGRWLAYSAEEHGAFQLRLMELTTGRERHFPHTDCNSITPTWGGDGRTLIFASDCMRNVGNTALFRMRVEGESGL